MPNITEMHWSKTIRKKQNPIIWGLTRENNIDKQTEHQNIQNPFSSTQIRILHDQKNNKKHKNKNKKRILKMKKEKRKEKPHVILYLPDCYTECRSLRVI
jgi:cystathionine beta-lyase family protein involved in aluminum resistance